jgi:hypothetical protein
VYERLPTPGGPVSVAQATNDEIVLPARVQEARGQLVEQRGRGCSR